MCTGPSYTCSLHANGDVRCWGQGMFGVLGWRNITTNELGNSFVPLKVQDMDPIEQLACGQTHVCALSRSLGEVWCWGFSNEGQIPNASLGISFQPVKTTTTPKAMQVVVGGWHTCALLEDYSMQCWGAQNNPYRPVPATRVNIPSGSTLVGALVSTLVVTCTGGVLVWGQDPCTQSTSSYAGNKLPCTASKVVRALSASSVQLCVMDPSSNVWCSGRGGGLVPVQSSPPLPPLPWPLPSQC